MPEMTVKVEMLDSDYVRDVLRAAMILLLEIEEYDQALIPDAIAEKALRLRAACQVGLDA